jgi:SET domain-containing protein
VSLKAVDGKYCINFYAKRDVAAGEELCYNYHSCTDVMKVWTDG